MTSDDRFPSVRELLASMVSYETINSNNSGRKNPEERLVGFLQDLAERSGLETKRFAVPDNSDDLLIIFRRKADLPWILFDSHLDTVSVDGMSIEPFAATEKDGRIWGRGACDTKGSGAAMFRALWEYARDAGSGARNAARGNNVALLFSVDEEYGMAGVRTFASKHYPGLGFKVKGTVVGEPTNLKTVVAHNGAVRYIVKTHGISAHSSNPAAGKSAISDMARLVTYLEDEFVPACDRFHPLTGKAQCSINTIRGGTASNIVPDSCEIQIDRRTIPGESTDEAVDGFKKALGEFEKRFPKSEITWEISIDLPSFDSSDSAPFPKAVLGVMARMGFAGTGIGATYGTHAADLQKRGIPAVVLGPGDISQAHTKDEWIEISELDKAVGVYKRLMMEA